MSIRKKKAAQTRNQLMESACALFLAHGYNAVSLQQIAEDTGLTRGAFYWHFRTKEEILQAICERERQFIEGLLVDLFMERDMAADRHLEHILTELVKNYFENNRFRDYIALTWFKMEHLESLQVNHLKRIANQYFIAECTELIQTGIHSGVFKPSCTPHTSAMLLTALINGIYRLYFIAPGQMDQKTAHDLVTHYVAAIRS